MKRIFRLMKKSISLLLVLSMFMTLSSTAFAAGTTNNEATVNLSKSLTLINPIVDWGLEKLAGGIVSSIAGKGVDKAFGAIFGTDTERIMSSLNEMNGKFDAINKQLDDITTQLDDLKKQLGDITTQLGDITKQMAIDKLSKNLDDYSEFIKDYQNVYKQLSMDMESYANDPEMTNVYLTEIYNASDPNYFVDSNSILNSTIKLGSRLLIVQTSGYNVFGTFDVLDKYTHRWEHQGYADRKAFRDVAIATYTIFSAISQLACETVILNNQGNDSKSKFIRGKATNWLTSLKNNATEVSNMNKRCAIVEHHDLRIYRDIKTGTDQYVFYKNVGKSYMNYNPSFEDFDLSKSPNYYMQSMTGNPTPLGKRNSPGVNEIWTSQATEESYKKIYTDYGEKVTLYHIFFDADKGGFNNSSDLPQYTPFAGNYYKQIDSKWNGSLCRRITFHAINTNGQVSEDGIGYFMRFGSGEPYFDDYEPADLEYFNIMMYQGTVVQGALQSPGVFSKIGTDGLISGMERSYNLPYSGGVTLSVKEKTGCTYQWMIAKGDSFEELTGETNKTYTLPKLEASMNGYQYRCYIIKNGGVDISDYALTDPVTLFLTGEGVPPAKTVPPAVTVHEVANANELTDALVKVNKGDWNEHTLKLTANIEYPLPISIIYYGVHIDLNGYVLNVNPDGTAQPNIEPDASTASIAAVYVDNYGLLDLTGDGALNVVADDGATYGVYAARNSTACVTAVTSMNCVSAVYVTDGSTVTVDSVSAVGDNSYGVECSRKSTVNINGSVTASGKSSCGAYVDGWNENASVSVGGDITVSGKNSRGVFLSGKNAELNVDGNVTVTGGAAGVSADKGSAVVGGNITAPANAVNVWNGANVTVKGKVISTDEDAIAVSSSGADVYVFGDVNSTGKGGTGISAAAWNLDQPTVGAKITVDGKINASTHLKIENLLVEESKHTENTSKEGYYTFTDGTSIVWAKPGSFVMADEPDPAPNPQTGDSSLPLTLWLLLEAGALALATLTLQRGSLSSTCKSTICKMKSRQ